MDHVRLQQVSMEESSFRKARFANLAGSALSIVHCEMDRSLWDQCNLREVSITASSGHKVRFDFGSFTGVSIRDSNFSRSRWEGLTLSDGEITECVFHRAHLQDISLHRLNANQCDLRHLYALRIKAEAVTILTSQMEGAWAVAATLDGSVEPGDVILRDINLVLDDNGTVRSLE